MRATLILLCLQAGFTGSGWANVILVPSVQPTIQAGINAAGPGDTVLVGPGTYTGPSNRNLDFGGKSIVLRSSAGPATTIIDCQHLARGIRFHTGEQAAAVVQGFTIRNGLANGTLGGGILVESGANPTIRSCRFESNQANTGGAVAVTGSAVLSNCEFSENTAANYGGGMYAESGVVQVMGCAFIGNGAGLGAGFYASFGAVATLADCNFTENIAANLAGGVHASASVIEIRRCSFLRNAGKHGAGAYLLESSATVDSCTFTFNTATHSGGGLHAEEVDPLTVTECTFQSNAALDVLFQFPSGGGGLYLESHSVSNPLIADCTFTGNEARGGVGAGGGGVKDRSRALFERCTFVNNSSDDRGGGGETGGRFHECIFEGNSSPAGGGLRGGYELIDCRFTNNHSDTFGGGCWLGGGGPDGSTSYVVGCEFSDNSANSRGGGLYSTLQFYLLRVEDTRFLDNSSLDGAGVFAWCGQASSFDGCTFVGNAATSGGAIEVQGPAPAPAVTVTGSTIVANTGLNNGGGLRLTIPVQIANTIIAFGTQGEAIACSGAGVGVMSCTDIFDNAGGDWTSCIADQVGINGNFSLDPGFCNVGGRDYTLAQTSPCSPAHSPAGCGLIGAHPVGCATPIGIADGGAPTVTPVLRVTPNPLRGAGMIEWSGMTWDEGAEAPGLRLYDASGRLVARHDPGPAGRQPVGHLSWSALVGSKDVPSGVYFLSLGERAEGMPSVRLAVIR